MKGFNFRTPEGREGVSPGCRGTAGRALFWGHRVSWTTARGGFTLLELLVATVIFGLVVAAAYTLFNSGRLLASRTELRSQLFQTARAALKAIEDDLKGAVMASTAYDTGFIGTDSGSPDKPLDQIDFVAVNNHAMISSLKSDDALQPSIRMDLSRVTYWVEGDAKKPAHGLVRYRQTILNQVTPPTPQDQDIEEVSPDVVYLNFRYYDGSQWQDSWDSTQSGTVPQAAEVTVYVRTVWQGQEYLEKFTERFYLPVAAQTPKKQQ